MKVLELIKLAVCTATPGFELDKVRTVLGLHGIKCNYDPPGSDNSRALFHTNKFNSKNWDVAQNCNGLIIDYKTWRILCHTPEITLVKYKTKEVDAHLKAGNYNAYAAGDGTVVNLYYYNNKWCISTARGIDMGDVSWMDITYTEALADAGLDYDNLDTLTNYTFGFTHPKMHPLHKSTKLWYISSYTGGSRSWTDPPKNIPQQTSVEVKSIEEAEKLLNDDNVFGIILRSNKPATTGVNSTILLESKLMQDIRQLMYDRIMTDDANIMSLNRRDYVVTCAALDRLRTARFIKLFPSLETDVKRVQSAVESTVIAISTNELSSGYDCLWKNELDKISSSAHTKPEQIMELICRHAYAAMWCRMVFE